MSVPRARVLPQLCCSAGGGCPGTAQQLHTCIQVNHDQANEACCFVIAEPNTTKHITNVDITALNQETEQTANSLTPPRSTNNQMHRSQAAHHQISFSSTKQRGAPSTALLSTRGSARPLLTALFLRFELHVRVREAVRPTEPCCLAAEVPSARVRAGPPLPARRRPIGAGRGRALPPPPHWPPPRALAPPGPAEGGGPRSGRERSRDRAGRATGAGGGTGAGCRAAPPRPSLTWPVPPSRVHPAAQPAFLGRGAVPERRRLRAEQQRVRRLPAAAVAERWARGVEAVVQQPAAQRAGGGGRCPRGCRGLRAELLPHGGGVSLPFVSRLSSGRARRSLRSRRPQLRAPGMRRPSARSPLPCGDGAGVVAAAARCRGAAAALRRERGAPGSRGPGTCGPRAGGSRRPSPPRGVAPRPRARPALHPEPLGQRSAPCPASRVPQRLGATRVTLSAAGLARFPYLGVPCAALLLVL